MSHWFDVGQQAHKHETHERTEEYWRTWLRGLSDPEKIALAAALKPRRKALKRAFKATARRKP